MAYKSISFYITKKNHDFELAMSQVEQGTALRNKVQFLLRQRYFARKGTRWDSEAILNDFGMSQDFLIDLDVRPYALGKLSSELAKSEEFNSLPATCASQIGQRLSENWKSFWALVKMDSVRKVGLPGYSKRFSPLPIHRNSLNQKKLAYIDKVGMSSWKSRFNLPEGYRHVKYATLTAVNSYKLKFTVVCLDEDNPSEYRGKYVAGLDFGLDNLFTIALTDTDVSFAVSGKPLKRINNIFNKKKEALTSRYSVEQYNLKNKGVRVSFSQTNLIQSLSNNRTRRIMAYANAATSEVIRELQKAEVATLIIGYNKGMKDKSRMSKASNYKFVSIPHKRILDLLAYKCEKNNIEVIWTEESYTSKSSFLDNDPLPVYGDGSGVVFSGRRVSRSEYQASDGRVIHADLNAAFNIIRKVVPSFSLEDVGSGVGAPRLRLLSVNA